MSGEAGRGVTAVDGRGAGSITAAVCRWAALQTCYCQLSVVGEDRHIETANLTRYVPKPSGYCNNDQKETTRPVLL